MVPTHEKTKLSIIQEIRDEMVCRLSIHFKEDLDIGKKTEDLEFLENLFEIEKKIYQKSSSLETYKAEFETLYKKPKTFFAINVLRTAEAKGSDNYCEFFSQPKNLSCNTNNDQRIEDRGIIKFHKIVTNTPHPLDDFRLKNQQNNKNGNESPHSSSSIEFLDYSFSQSPTQAEKKSLNDQALILESFIENLSAPMKIINDPPTLQHLFRALIDYLKAQPEAKPFLKPIETSRLKSIPKYLKSLTKPIDFTTIEEKLKVGDYDSMWSLIADVKGMTDSICSFYRKKLKIFRCAEKLAEIFDGQTARVMEKLEYCCNQNHRYLPRLISCGATEKCAVQLGADYYRYNEYIVCLVCYEKSDGEIKLYNRSVKKTFFNKLHNPLDPIPEPMVECLNCHQKLHQICAQFLAEVQKEFYCERCRKNLGIKSIKLRASSLPSTNFSAAVEEHLKEFLDSTILEGKIFVRVLCDKFKIHGKLKEFADLSGPEQYSYRHRNLFVFYELDGEDYCIFSIQMQLYGSECAPPNNNCAYLSYLDSVCLIDSKIRTLFYKNLVLSVFKTLKLRGYHWLYLWSCPPKQGDDYIFNIKPQVMKMPSRSKLISWYKSLLEMGVGSELMQFANAAVFAKDEDWARKLHKVPYFKGDIWPQKIEETILQVKTDYKTKRVKGLQALLQITRLKQQTQLNKKKKKVWEETLQLYRDFNFDDALAEALTKLFKLYNEDYFIVQLNSPTDERIEDTDLLLNHDLMDEPHQFLNHFSDKKLEFSNRRRIKFSTSYILLRSLKFQKRCFLCGVDISCKLLNSSEDFCIKCLVNQNTYIEEQEVSNYQSNCKDLSVYSPLNLNLKDEAFRIEVENYDSDADYESYDSSSSSNESSRQVIKLRNLLTMYKTNKELRTNYQLMKPAGTTGTKKHRMAEGKCKMRDMIQTIKSKITPQVAGTKPKKISLKKSSSSTSREDFEEESFSFSQDFKVSNVQASSSRKIVINKSPGGCWASSSLKKEPEDPEKSNIAIDLSSSRIDTKNSQFSELEKSLSEIQLNSIYPGIKDDTFAMELDDTPKYYQMLIHHQLPEVEIICDKLHKLNEEPSNHGIDQEIQDLDEISDNSQEWNIDENNNLHENFFREIELEVGPIPKKRRKMCCRGAHDCRICRS